MPNPNVEKPPFNAFAEAGDTSHWEFFETLHLSYQLPKIGGVFQVTKFHILLAVAAFLVAVMMIWLGRKMKNGDVPRGTLWNMLESILFFVRDDIARPGIGEHDGDKYVPYLTTTFLFILVANMLGMIPFLGSPTASLAVTAALALVSFAVIHVSGIRENGLTGYLKSYIPHIELDGPTKLMGIFLIPLLAVIEILTPFLRTVILAVRLFANMLAGHTALFVLMFFIKMVSDPKWLAYNEADSLLYYIVMPFSVLMVTALTVLELMVAALQAFIFTLLTAIFIGLAKHPAH